MLNIILQLFGIIVIGFFLGRLYKTNLLTGIIGIVYLGFFILVGGTIEYTIAIQIVGMGFFYSEIYNNDNFFNVIVLLALVITIVFLFVDWATTLPIFLLAIFGAGLGYHISEIIKEFKINKRKYFKYIEIIIFICLLVGGNFIFIDDRSYIAYGLPIICFAAIYVIKKDIMI